MTIFSLQLFRRYCLVFAGSLGLLIPSVILGLPVPVWSNEPAEPQNFLGWCQTKSSWPIATQRTINYLLSASSNDCVKAAQQLEARTELLNSDPNFASTGITDLRPLASLTKLQSINIISDELTDLRPLAKMQNLAFLGIARSNLTDLTPLIGLKKLRMLRLLYCKNITSLQPLSQIPQLNEILVWNSPVSDLSPLSQLPNLAEINLVGTQVADLRPLAPLKSLRRLEIVGSKVQNLQGIAGLTGLQKVTLSENKIQDLRSIAKLTNLT